MVRSAPRLRLELFSNVKVLVLPHKFKVVAMTFSNRWVNNLNDRIWFNPNQLLPFNLTIVNQLYIILLYN